MITIKILAQVDNANRWWCFYYRGLSSLCSRDICTQKRGNSAGIFVIIF